MKINITNDRKIESALLAANRRAVTHTITTAAEVRRIADRADHKLSNLPKKDQRGVVVQHQSAAPKALDYRYTVATTYLELTRFATGWFLSAVERDWVRPGGGDFTNYIVAAAQKQAMIAATFGDIIEA